MTFTIHTYGQKSQKKPLVSCQQLQIHWQSSGNTAWKCTDCRQAPWYHELSLRCHETKWLAEFSPYCGADQVASKSVRYLFFKKYVCTRNCTIHLMHINKKIYIYPIVFGDNSPVHFHIFTLYPMSLRAELQGVVFDIYFSKNGAGHQWSLMASKSADASRSKFLGGLTLATRHRRTTVFCFWRTEQNK